MIPEDDWLPISALQHLLFCPRQCALIHVEQAWAENALTAQGRQLHDRAHESGPESRGDLRIVRGLRLHSRSMGLTGQADVVELHAADDGTPPGQRACLPAIDGVWSVVPVEYKRGQPKENDCDRVQLCAQAMCLEEMVGASIPRGALYYGQPRRREGVDLDEPLRELVRDTARRLHELVRSGIVPPAEPSAKCVSCSLAEQCMPKSAGQGRSARNYLKRQIEVAIKSPSPEDAP